MVQLQKVHNFIIRLMVSALIIGISCKQIQESNYLIKSAQDNISKAKSFLYSFKFYNIGFLYKISPRLILIMNYSLLASAILFLFQIDGYTLLANNSLIIQLIFVNNMFLDQSSKCYLIVSSYISIYGAIYYFKTNLKN